MQTQNPLITSRVALILSVVLAALVTIAILCGGNLFICISVVATDGTVALGWLVGAAALGSVLLQCFKIQTNRALHLATAGGLGLGIYGLSGLGLGLLAHLNRPVANAFPLLSVLLFVVAAIKTRSVQSCFNFSEWERYLREPAGIAWLWLIPVISLTIAAVSATLMPGILWHPDPHPYDVTGYHLLVPREWFEVRRISPLAHNVFSYFPFNVEMQFLLLMHATGGPWAAMYSCQFLCVGYAVLMLLGVYGACRTGAAVGAKSATIAAALTSTVPWFIMLAGVAYVESALMLYTVLAIAWALHAVRHRDQLLRAATLSGVMAGLACGVKITAVPMLLSALSVGLLLVLLIRRPHGVSGRKALAACVALGLAGTVVLSPWLIRNAVWCGNPIFPLGMKVLGQDHFSDEQVIRFATAHSPLQSQKTFASKIATLWNAVITDRQYGYFILPAGLGALALNHRKRETWLLFICGLFVLTVWIGFTHLLPRFLVMLIPILAISIGRCEWHRAWPVGIVLVLVAAGVGWSYTFSELSRSTNPPPFQGESQPALMGMKDLTFMKPPDLIEAINLNPRLQVALIGDAQAFLYQVPLSQLHYRSVFNVTTGTSEPIDAWIGPQVRGNPNWFLVVNPMEISRLHSTYESIPPWPDFTQVQLQRTFFLRGDQLPKK